MRRAHPSPTYHAVRGVGLAVVGVDVHLEHSAVAANEALQPPLALRTRLFGADQARIIMSKKTSLKGVKLTDNKARARGPCSSEIPDTGHYRTASAILWARKQVISGFLAQGSDRSFSIMTGVSSS